MDWKNERENKKHKAPHAGRKADKKDSKDKETRERKKEATLKLPARQRNPKAFAIQNVTKMRKNVLRTLEKKEKKVHIAVVDRTPVEPPPIIVAIVGPPKVGKSLLMKALIRNYSRQRLSDIKGPVTVVASKTRRITFIECKNDINSMIDIAKVVDLAILLIDASFGMEMETFEFLNICQVHGFPKILGVLNHLDYFNNIAHMRKVKKVLKRRFWTEVYQGAKLFNLSGLMYEEYLHHEIHNLCRFISIIKFRPLVWRNTHPYILADRMEDITDPEDLRQDATISRSVSLYGWMRGVPMKNNSTVHIPGCGDHTVNSISILPDPCPMPGKLKKRKLSEVERQMYAPMTGVGGVIYDKDAVYIDVSEQMSKPAQTKKDGKNHENEVEDEMIFKNALINTQTPLDVKLQQSSLSLFSNSAPITSEQFQLKTQGMTEEMVHQEGRIRRRAKFNDQIEDIDEESDDESDDGFGEGNQSEEGEERLAAPDSSLSNSQEQDNEQLVFDDGSDDEIEFNYNVADSSIDVSLNDSLANSSLQQVAMRESGKGDVYEDVDDGEEGSEEEESDEEDGQLKWKENLAARAATNFLNRQKSTPNLRKLVYEINEQPANSGKEELADGLFKVVKPSSTEALLDNVDCTRSKMSLTRAWTDEEAKQFIRDCFTTGKWENDKDAKTLLSADDSRRDNAVVDMEKQVKEDEGEEEEEINDEDNPDINRQKSQRVTREQMRQKAQDKRSLRKQQMKVLFDQAYDKITTGADIESHWDLQKAELDDQATLNKSEFKDMDDETRALYEGYRAGLYVRIELKNMPCEFVDNFDPYTPLVVGGMTNAESVIGATHIRLKKHRWYDKILKTKDPLIFSVGWRRFQSMPLYTVQDHNGRNRALKYTPQFMHCNAVFWGPATPQNTGVLCLQELSSSMKGFRVAATGVVLAVDKSFVIMKKLKLIGHPMKCHKKTAFIKDMFSSPLEVAKFEGARIQSVSGIRGQVKKAIKEPAGAFRAMFEDTILTSDIVFVKTWYQVDIPKFYVPVTNMLLKFEGDKKPDWQGMRTLGKLRKELGIKAPFSLDSQYQKVPERKQHHLKETKLPTKLLAALPFDHKEKKTLKFEDPIRTSRVTVVRDKHEMQVNELLHRMQVIDKVRKEKKSAKQKEVKTQKKKELKKVLVNSELKRKEARKRVFRDLGRMKTKKKRTNDSDAY